MRLLNFPSTNVMSKLPNICEDIMRAQKRPNNYDFLFSSATKLVYAPWATQRTEADTPQMRAPKITQNQTTACGISI